MCHRHIYAVLKRHIYAAKKNCFNYQFKKKGGIPFTRKEIFPKVESLVNPRFAAVNAWL